MGWERDWYPPWFEGYGIKFDKVAIDLAEVVRARVRARLRARPLRVRVKLGLRSGYRG